MKNLLILLLAGLYLACTTIDDSDDTYHKLQGSWSLSSFYCEDIEQSNKLNRQIKNQQISLTITFNRHDFSQTAYYKLANGKKQLQSKGVYIADSDGLRIDEAVVGTGNRRMIRFLDLEVEDEGSISIGSDELCDGKPGVAIFKRRS
ncbi:hypothetical protein [Pseudobacteriovorax antillogorgiicola]|uniref:Lipocalin-like domain-containing protein n=1 Tax=Pseudobacteriovorax antillogorgiicola TaxID=1513793 RepID=A0A1Y6B700_9BACT|nr:hypothetical protein [Pseudobacteriovorax antillogorgiicola]TCS58858.1 hypothetical protein EDD56_102373 [Pseudobacteriovorax antillogorgiicola]SME93971.1 hypothetical protein SAMN06296036_10270 [Pseudobacteriovorax antillogorgiicola]